MRLFLLIKDYLGSSYVIIPNQFVKLSFPVWPSLMAILRFESFKQ